MNPKFEENGKISKGTLESIYKLIYLNDQDSFIPSYQILKYQLSKFTPQDEALQKIIFRFN